MKTLLALLLTSICAQAQLGFGTWFTADTANQGDQVTLVTWIGNGDPYSATLRVDSVINQQIGNELGNPACVVSDTSTNYYPHGATNYFLDAGQSLYVTNTLTASTVGVMSVDTWFVASYDYGGFWLPSTGNWPAQITVVPAPQVQVILQQSADLTNWTSFTTNIQPAIGTNLNFRLKVNRL